MYNSLVYKTLLLIIITLGFLLRVVGLSEHPVGFTPDEASFGYDAYSLLKTGKDQWGVSNALSVRSFGDFKLPLYAYLTIPSVGIFGLNEFATRLPNAVFGTLAVIATYLMVRELAKSRLMLMGKQINADMFAIIAAFMLTISPWHISLSRGAFEANLTTFFMPLGVWAFYKGLTKPKWMVFSALLFGLNMYSYHSARLLTPLIVLVLVLVNKIKLSEAKTQKGAIFVFGVFALVAFYSMFLGSASRSADVAIFNPTDRWASVSDRRYEALLAGLPDSLSRLFSNKITYVFDQLVGGYFSYLSPQFLFVQGAGEWTYGMIPGRGALYLIEVAFVVLAIWSLIKYGIKSSLIVVVAWILLSPIPAALAKGPGYAANRAAIMMPAIQIFSAYGALVLFELIKKKWIFTNSKRIFSAFAIAMVISLGMFLEDYVYHAPRGSAESMLYGRKEALEFAKSVEGQYEKIIVSRSLSEPHIYVAFYSGWDPTDFQKQSPDWLRYEKEGRSFLDQLGEYSLGKYSFGDVDFRNSATNTGLLLIGKVGEFPQNIVPLKQVNYPNGRKAVLVVDPQSAN